MTTESFPNIPEFPDTVPTAPLLRLSFKDLVNGDVNESDKLFKVCKELGFFYLDLRGIEEGESILKDADALFQVSEQFFNLDVDEKLKYDFSAKGTYFGYKRLGANYVDKVGNLDRHEFYNIAKDDIFGLIEPFPAPEVVSEKRPLVKSYMSNAHGIVTLLLSLLSNHLHLPKSTLLGIHRLQANSGDQVRFIRAPPQPITDRRLALGEHTDFGSITVLFNRLGGLQILPPGKDAEWCYVRPLPGHAIVNLGDAMVKFTNGLLRSNIHRVISPPGLQADSTRYSLVYFARPEDSVVLKRLEGSDVIPELAEGTKEEEINSKEWILRRALRGNPKMKMTPEEVWEKTRGTEVQSQRIAV